MQTVVPQLTWVLCWGVLFHMDANAQQVYRCEVQGQASYSHEPCLGAKSIDTTPTQGMDKMTGTSRKSTDVQREVHRRQLSEIYSRHSGLSPETHTRLARRYQLPRAVQLECASWDMRLPGLEKALTQASAAQQKEAERHLFEGRQTFRDLRC